jgi:hypothetical protein
VTAQEVEQVSYPNPSVTTRRPERSEATVVDPILHRAGVDLQQIADLVGGQEPIRIERSVVHVFHVLKTFPVLVNVTRVSLLTLFFDQNRQTIDASTRQMTTTSMFRRRVHIDALRLGRGVLARAAKVLGVEYRRVSQWREELEIEAPDY